MPSHRKILHILGVTWKFGTFFYKNSSVIMKLKRTDPNMQSWDRPTAIKTGEKQSIFPRRNLPFVSPRTVNTLPFALIRALVTTLSFDANPVFRPNARLYTRHGMSHYKLTTFH